MSQYEARQRYRKWWVGKLCRTGGAGPFRMVTDIKLFGPPSFVYGGASLVFEDGSEVPIFCGKAYKPRKCDVEVAPNKQLQTDKGR